MAKSIYAKLTKDQKKRATVQTRLLFTWLLEDDKKRMVRKYTHLTKQERKELFSDLWMKVAKKIYHSDTRRRTPEEIRLENLRKQAKQRARELVKVYS